MIAPTILVLLASQVDATASFGLSAENRTGKRPVSPGAPGELVTEFELAPRGAIDLRLKRTSFNIFYAPRAYTRILLQGDNAIQRPLFLHGFGVGFDHAFTANVRLTISAVGSVGEVDYGNVNLVQGTGQQVPCTPPQDPRCRAGMSASGATGNDSIFSTQDYNANLNLSWNVTRNHAIAIGGGGNYNASLGSRSDQQFPPNYGGNGGIGWSWRFDPNYSFNLNLNYGESRVEPATGGTTGKFRSVSASAGFDLRPTRVFNMAINGGALVADNDPVTQPGDPTPPPGGISASPTGNISFTFIPTSGQGLYHLSTTLGAGVEGFVDPLVGQGFAPRLAFNWSLNFTFYQDWSLSPSASLFTPLSAPPAQNQMMQDSLNETLLSFGVPLSYRINQELAMALGVRVSARGSNLRAADPQLTDWFVLGFLSFTAGVVTRL